MCKFVHRTVCSTILKQTLKPRDSRATLSQFCGLLIISKSQKAQCHFNTATFFWLPEPGQLELAQMSLQQDTVQTCPLAFTHQWVTLALKAVPRPSIFILVEVHQCQGLYMFKIRLQTDIVILESNMGRPSPPLLTFRAQCKVHLFVRAFLQCKLPFFSFFFSDCSAGGLRTLLLCLCCIIS